MPLFLKFDRLGIQILRILGIQIPRICKSKITAAIRPDSVTAKYLDIAHDGDNEAGQNDRIGL